jgi:lipopolysaccharide biosynthesis protein
MIRAIAFYLPQYHPIPENDEWWGKGFTEWTNVTRARPLFPGHYQPHVPADLGYYDLRVPEVREAQARMAREYGVHGFCYYHYSFSGKRLLERPFNEVLQSGKPDFPFCLCWANESWTRVWDGGESQILMQQVHSDESDRDFIREVIPAFKDPRYIRVDGRPLFLVYRTELLPDPKHTVRIWRDECLKAGVGELHLCRTESRECRLDPAEHGFDSAYEFPPHGMPPGSRVEVDLLWPNREGVDAGFDGLLWQYEVLVRGFLRRGREDYKLFRGLVCSWDNTPRRMGRATLMLDASPELYRYWLSRIVSHTREWHQGDEQLVFINAWNEWAEGCHLEPDRRFGYRWLEATRHALQQPDELDALLAQAEEASKSPAAARAWITRASALLRRQDDTLRAALSDLGGTDRGRLEEIARLRHDRLRGYRLIKLAYRVFDFFAGRYTVDGLPTLPRPR